MAKHRSDDTILADAEEARERERTGKVATEDQFEHLREEVKDAPVKAKLEGASPDRVAELQKRIEQLETTLKETVKGQLVSGQALREMRDRGLKRADIPQCPHCEQPSTVCAKPDAAGNHHVTARVLPRRPEHMANFPGIIWNNVVYCGIRVIPAVAAQDIMAKLNNWEEYKFGLHQNRGRTIGRTRAITEAVPRGGFPIFGS